MSINVTDLPPRVLCRIFFEFTDVPARWRLLSAMRLVCKRFSSLICEHLPTLDISGSEVLTPSHNEDDHVESLFLATVLNMPRFSSLTVLMMEYTDVARSQAIPVMRKMPKRGMTTDSGESGGEKGEEEGSEADKTKEEKEEKEERESTNEQEADMAYAVVGANRDLKTPPALLQTRVNGEEEDRKHGIVSTSTTTTDPPSFTLLPSLLTDSNDGTHGHTSTVEPSSSITISNTNTVQLSGVTIPNKHTLQSAVSPIRQALQHLLVLSLHGAYINDIDVLCIAHACPGLLVLDLSKSKRSDAHMITDASIMVMGGYVPGLVNLNLSYTNITDLSITALCSACHQLQKLYIEGCHRITDQSLGYNGIGHCRTLRNLNISNIPLLTDQGLHMMVSMFDRAKYPLLSHITGTGDGTNGTSTSNEGSNGTSSDGNTSEGKSASTSNASNVSDSRHNTHNEMSILSTRRWHPQALSEPHVRVPLRSLIANALSSDKVSIKSVHILLKLNHLHLCMIPRHQNNSLQHTSSGHTLLGPVIGGLTGVGNHSAWPHAWDDNSERMKKLVRTAVEADKHIILRAKDLYDYNPLSRVRNSRVVSPPGSRRLGRPRGGYDQYHSSEDRYSFFYNKEGMLAMMNRRDAKDCVVVMNHGCMFVHQPS